MLHDRVNLNCQLCLSGDICRACVGVRIFEQIWSLISSEFSGDAIWFKCCSVLDFFLIFKFLSCVELTSCLRGLLLPCFVLFFIFLFMKEFPLKKTRYLILLTASVFTNSCFSLFPSIVSYHYSLSEVSFYLILEIIVFY